MTDVTGDRAAEVDQEFLPLRALAYVLVTLLGGGVVLAVATLVLPLYLSGYLGHHAENASRDLARTGLVATVILFLVWFRRARINAERSSWRQRRARAWAVWGWIIPIGNLWIPFQLMGDVWRAGLPPERRTSTAWLPAVWWVSWLLNGVGSARYGPHFPHGWLTLCVYGIASLTLIAIIKIVSSGPVGEP
jgi:hypothetical protein